MKLTFNRHIVFNLVLITICLITIIFGDDLPFEFAEPTIGSIYFVIVCIVLPISIIWTGNQIFRFRSKAFAIATMLVAFPIIFILFFKKNMCDSTDKIIYTNSTNSSIVVARSFVCGTWDTDFSNYSYYKKTPFLGVFYLKTKVDTLRLNKSMWIRQ